MEARVAALEKKFDRIENKMDGVHREISDARVQIATLTERVSHLPGKGFIVTSTVAALALFSAVVVFGGDLRCFEVILPQLSSNVASRT